MSTSEKLLLKVLNSAAVTFGFDLSTDADGVSLHCRSSPIVMNFDLRQTGSAFLYLFVRTGPWDLPGERTDANELISVMLGGFLRISGCASCTLLDIPHPVSVPATEVYARYAILTQPSNSIYSLSDDGLSEIKAIISTVNHMDKYFGYLLDWDFEERNGDVLAESRYSWEEAESWASRVSEALSEPIDDNVQYCSRSNPTWMHYRSIRKRITVYYAPRLASAIGEITKSRERWSMLPGINGALYISESIRNIVPSRHKTLLNHVLCRLSDNKGSDMVIIPLENYIVAARDEYILFANCDCGIKRFETERNRIRTRHEQEATLLFPINQFTWSDDIDDDRFELLTLDLLKREEAINWVRKIGVSRERDGGRDLISEWSLPAIESSGLHEDVSPRAVRRIIIQSKASRKPIGKSKVQDIRDTVEHYEAQGYLLVTSHFLTTGLTEHLEKMRSQARIWVDWWTRSEIEDRLKKYPDLIAQYADILKPTRG